MRYNALCLHHSGFPAVFLLPDTHTVQVQKHAGLPSDSMKQIPPVPPLHNAHKAMPPTIVRLHSYPLPHRIPKAAGIS